MKIYPDFEAILETAEYGMTVGPTIQHFHSGAIMQCLDYIKTIEAQNKRYREALEWIISNEDSPMSVVHEARAALEEKE